MNCLKGCHRKYIILCLLSGLMVFAYKIAEAKQQPSEPIPTSDLCHQCHTLGSDPLLSENLVHDLCDYCHEDKEESLPQIAILHLDIDNRLDHLGERILQGSVSTQRRDARFQEAVEDYFAALEIAKTNPGRWSATDRLLLLGHLADAEAALTRLENQVRYGFLTAAPKPAVKTQPVLNSGTITFSTTFTAVLNALPSVPVLAVSFEYLQAMMLICLALALVQLLRHRAPPALFEMVVICFGYSRDCRLRDVQSLFFLQFILTRRVLNEA